MCVSVPESQQDHAPRRTPAGSLTNASPSDSLRDGFPPHVRSGRWHGTCFAETHPGAHGPPGGIRVYSSSLCRPVRVSELPTPRTECGFSGRSRDLGQAPALPLTGGRAHRPNAQEAHTAPRAWKADQLPASGCGRTGASGKMNPEPTCGGQLQRRPRSSGEPTLSGRWTWAVTPNMAAQL